MLESKDLISKHEVIEGLLTLVNIEFDNAKEKGISLEELVHLGLEKRNSMFFGLVQQVLVLADIPAVKGAMEHLLVVLKSFYVGELTKEQSVLIIIEELTQIEGTPLK